MKRLKFAKNLDELQKKKKKNCSLRQLWIKFLKQFLKSSAIRKDEKTLTYDFLRNFWRVMKAFFWKGDWVLGLAITHFWNVCNIP